MLRLPATHIRSLICFASGVHAILLGSCLAILRSQKVGEPSGPGSLFNRRPDLPVCLHVDVNGTSQVPRRSIPCLCPALRPRPNRRSLASLTVSSMLPPRFPRRRLQRLMNFGAQSRGFGTCCLRFKNGVATITCKARFRPAGLAFTGRASNPLDRYKRFQITFSSPFSGFILAQGKFHDVHPRAVMKLQANSQQHATPEPV